MEFFNHCESRNEVDGISIKKKKICNDNCEEFTVNEFDKLNDDCLLHIFLFLTNIERIKVESGELLNSY